MNFNYLILLLIYPSFLAEHGQANNAGVEAAYLDPDGVRVILFEYD